VTTPSAGDIKAQSRAIGFLACGICDLTPSAHGDALDAWLAQGYAGTMRYLHRQAARRKVPATITPGALRAVVLLENYYSPDTPDDLLAPRIAKYARGTDYHIVTMGRLRALADWMLVQGATMAHAWCDAGPVPERELAVRAGLGWIGKNTMLIRPQAGSWTFIGTIFTDLPLEVDAPFATDHCGTCTRCLDACPTQAFVGPQVLDATRCLSYQTIEHKGEIPADILPHMEGWAFGCDICNDVCPWNVRFAEPTPVAELRPRGGVKHILDNDLDQLDNARFTEMLGDTPLSRPGLDRMKRNVKAACPD
jgi:epoxyqueuosine reductase